MEVDVAVRWVPLQAVVSPRIRTCLQVRKVMVNNYNLTLLGDNCPFNLSTKKFSLYLFPASALIVVVGGAEALVAPGLRVSQVPGTVPGPGVQPGV